jgi:uncharacterized membrane protein YoaK (UPF0700 family)
VATARRDLVVLLLAVVGGSVDAIVLLAFGALSAAQTGNTILLALALAQGRLTAGLTSAVSVLGYVAGAAVGEAVIARPGAAPSLTRSVGRPLLGELIPLGGLLVAWDWLGPSPSVGAKELLVASAALAMGIQSAATLRLHAGPMTTYVTGTLTTFTMEQVRRLWFVGPQPTPWLPTRNPGPPPAELNPAIYGATWLTYLVGAVVGALLFLHVGRLALALPIAALLSALLVLGLRRRASVTGTPRSSR